MQNLFDVVFTDGQLPAGWIEEHRIYSFERGALRSGRAAILKIPVPGTGWGRLRLEAEVEPIGGAVSTCGDGTYTMVTDLERGRHRILFHGMSPLAETARPLPRQARYEVAFEFDHGRMRVLVDGVEQVAADDPRPVPAGGLIEMEFWDDCLVHRIRATGAEPVAPSLRPPPSPRREFWLEVNVDFADDLMHAPFTRGMFDRLFAEFERWGVKRCHWIYYGGSKNGWWDGCTRNIAGPNAAQTMRQAGEIFPAAVQAAHAHGVEIYGMIKPFDMGFWESLGEGTPEAVAHGKLSRIGGPIRWIADFAAQRRDLVMARKPGVFGPAINDRFTRIDLVKENESPAAFTVQDLQLWVSADNVTYRPYSGPVRREETVEDYPLWEHTASGGRPTGRTHRARVLRLTDLDIREKYFALAVEGRARSFANTLINLVHVFGPRGEERRLTYGVMARESVHVVPDKAALIDPTADFRTNGIEFDRAPGTPSGIFPGYDAIRAFWTLDAGEGFLAVAAGKDPGTIAALSPSFPETRAWWLSWVRDCLTAGADGIELRVRNHHSPFAWAEFGFEPPVVAEFKRRHGVDLIATDDFDQRAWERLRGEAYTQFYREARALTRQFGKPLGLHVSPTNDLAPGGDCAMNVHWDWPTWLDEGLADSVTMKEIWPRTRFAEAILAHTRPRGIPVVFCPYANAGYLWGPDAPGVKVCADWIRMAREGGFDGYQFYECAAVVRATPAGEVVMEQPALRDLFRREFGGKA